MATDPPDIPPPSPRRTIELPPPELPPPGRFTFIPPLRPHAWARWINIALGAWLFISPFIWPHGATSDANSWTVGLLIMVVGIIGLYVPQARWLNTALAVWLFFSTLVFAQAARTLWNNLIVALIVFVASLVPGGLGASSGSNGSGPFAPP